ncbi:hypothetical protein VNO77_34244 [Canavalia gladiata]|uniref:Uncharacterized protein n=1 Tax=Canavalia gladiata TaxID=3824 RepID=A0AAN9PZ33_CANGL
MDTEVGTMYSKPHGCSAKVSIGLPSIRADLLEFSIRSLDSEQWTKDNSYVGVTSQNSNPWLHAPAGSFIVIRIRFQFVWFSLISAPVPVIHTRRPIPHLPHYEWSLDAGKTRSLGVCHRLWLGLCKHPIMSEAQFKSSGLA